MAILNGDVCVSVVFSFCCSFGIITSFVNHEFPSTCVAVHEKQGHINNVYLIQNANLLMIVYN